MIAASSTLRNESRFARASSTASPANDGSSSASAAKANAIARSTSLQRSARQREAVGAVAYRHLGAHLGRGPFRLELVLVQRSDLERLGGVGARGCPGHRVKCLEVKRAADGARDLDRPVGVRRSPVPGAASQASRPARSCRTRRTARSPPRGLRGRRTRRRAGPASVFSGRLAESRLRGHTPRGGRRRPRCEPGRRSPTIATRRRRVRASPSEPVWPSPASAVHAPRRRALAAVRGRRPDRARGASQGRAGRVRRARRSRRPNSHATRRRWSPLRPRGRDPRRGPRAPRLPRTGRCPGPTGRRSLAPRRASSIRGRGRRLAVQAARVLRSDSPVSATPPSNGRTRTEARANVR